MGAGWRRLWQTMAVGGIGLSLYAGLLTVDDVRDRASSERDIAAGCDHLVSGAQVMDLQGGMVRAQSSDYDEYRLDARELPSACTIDKVSDSRKTTELFRLIVESSNDSEPVNVVGDRDSPFSTLDGYDQKDDVTAVADRKPEPWPLGDGTLGSYTNFRTTIRAECGSGSGKAAPRLLNVTAVARYPDVSAEDRQRLARIAHSATQQLTRRIGCRTRLPALPDQMPGVPSKLRKATAATGSCRWAGHLLKEEEQGRLPDRALTIHARDANPVEGCLLAASPRRVRAIADSLDVDQRDYAEGALTYSPWWLRTVSYFGAEAESVGYVEVGDDVKLRPGTAGGKDGIWWASSICDGKPALHTLTAAHVYDNVLGHKAISSLFRAYVDDITTRRGCTHVTYPAAKDFRDV
ncbi:hypothetical protein [Streptomyces sp. AcE210]|uniref:hypothetical protein n=1 Tax=Streptomyces sp. AcE210 TaxID=2292703 RepID=UPI000E305905|nr:hypothetical protein [Streptomyces sp. AcE210]RFC77377.1 hypothetical protein DXZ75_05345 [Streptomyces sp. AcE210]